MKTSKPTKNNKETPKISAAGREKKNSPPPASLINVAACSSLSLDGEELFSPLTGPGPSMNDFSAYGLVNNHKNHKNNEISVPHLHRNK